jgi:hypothetical protein
MASSQCEEPKRYRILHALQAVFLTSNRGGEVNEPPKEAFQVFRRSLTFQRSSSQAKKSSFQSIRRSNNNNNRLTGNRSESKNIICENSPCVTSDRSKEKPPVAKARRSSSNESPEQFLEILMNLRGYFTKQHESLRTAYFNRSSALQKASYHAFLVNIVEENDAKALLSIMECGISPNPCNNHRESLMQVACRLSKHECLKVMIESGAWSARLYFATVGALLKEYPSLLLMTDARGSPPLVYVRKDQWGVWLDFLYPNRD